MVFQSFQLPKGKGNSPCQAALKSTSNIWMTLLHYSPGSTTSNDELSSCPVTHSQYWFEWLADDLQWDSLTPSSIQARLHTKNTWTNLCTKWSIRQPNAIRAYFCCYSMMLKPQNFTSLLDFFGALNRAATAGSYFLPVSPSSISFIYIPIST